MELSSGTESRNNDIYFINIYTVLLVVDFYLTRVFIVIIASVYKHFIVHVNYYNNKYINNAFLSTLTYSSNLKIPCNHVITFFSRLNGEIHKNVFLI